MITDITHPYYDIHTVDWQLFRDISIGGKHFIDKYLERFSLREDDADFASRKRISYNPAHAMKCIDEIKNSIFQRMVDIKRENPSRSYTLAADGKIGGVNNRGQSMNQFLSDEIILELLTMGRVGIFVDKEAMPTVFTKAEANESSKPYMYKYCAEDILSWSYSETSNVLESVLLRDIVLKRHPDTYLVVGTTEQYRLITRDSNGVLVKIYERYLEGGKTHERVIREFRLNLDRIPFVIIDLKHSLLKDVARYQVSLLNLASSDMNYAFKSNYPFYTEQFDANAEFAYNMQSFGGPERNAADTAGYNGVGEQTSASTARNKEVKTGTTQGRQYPKGMDRPDFIHPSPEPLLASMKKQAELKSDIRQLVNLAVESLNSQSAESKAEDKEGLESGLACIGLHLEHAENEVARIWNNYGGEDTLSVSIKYPLNYKLRTDSQRRSEADELLVLLPSLPSVTYQKVISKEIADITVGHKVSADVLSKIKEEIDSSVVVAMNPEVLREDHEAGFVSTETASRARLYPKGEVEQAKKDHEERAIRIAAAQSSVSIANAGARGIPDLDTETDSGKKEKEQSRNTDFDPTTKDKTRGEANK